MIARRTAAAATLHAQRCLARGALAPAARCAQVRMISQADIEDPNMNGGYVNPPRQKRQFRDPYGDWWDKQERRNFGEPVHEDDVTLAMFSPEEYTHTPPGKALLQLALAIGSVFGLAGVVSFFYPDKPAVPRTFPGGLETELGGPGAVRARKEGEGHW